MRGFALGSTLLSRTLPQSATLTAPSTREPLFFSPSSRFKKKRRRKLAPLGQEIAYRFPKAQVNAVHLVFDSDLERDTLDGNHCERIHTTSALYRLDAPFMHMPTTLCRAFTLYGECEGKREALLSVTDNRKRAYHIPVEKEFDSLILIPTESWGAEDSTPVISFDFT